MSVRIGISCDILEHRVLRAAVPLTYLDWMYELGATPILIPPDSRSVELLDSIHGLLIVGGDDYRLGNEFGEPANFVPVYARREEADIAWARATAAADLPCLGVCGGFQLLTLVDGGKIFGDLPTESPSHVVHKGESTEQGLPRHTLQWTGPDPTWEVPAGTYEVNSHHHQGVCELPDGWRAEGVADDGLVEAARGPGAFRYGVQWHPERDTVHPLNRGLALGFLAASRQRSRT